MLLNQPETGALVSEYDIRGRALRSVGTLRPTGHDGDTQLRLAFNAGLPVPIPGGGLYFVFQTGEPRFRKYDAGRHAAVRARDPGTRTRRSAAVATDDVARASGPGRREIPIVRPVVRVATVDPSGHLWISFTVPFTYVYDADGEKARTVQLRGAGLLTPTSLFFTSDGRLLVTPGCYVFRP